MKKTLGIIAVLVVITLGLIAASPQGHWITIFGADWGIVDSSNNKIADFEAADKSFKSYGPIDVNGLLRANAAASVTGTLTLSGTTSNIALGSNYLSGDGGDEGISVSSTGKVGINQNNPFNALEVFGISGGAGLNGSDGTGGIRASFATGYGVALDVWDGSIPKWGITKYNIDSPVTVMEGNYSNSNVTFKPGNVSIGSAPLGTAKLTVTEATSGLTSVGSNYDGIVIQNNGSTGITLATSGDSAAFISYASGDINDAQTAMIGYVPAQEYWGVSVHSSGGSTVPVVLFGMPSNTVNSYFYGDITATGYADPTEDFVGTPKDAAEEIMKIRSKDGQIDHSTLGQALVVNKQYKDYYDIVVDGKVMQSFEGVYKPDIVDVTKAIPLLVVTPEDALEEVDEVVIDMVLRYKEETHEVKKVFGYRTFFKEANGQVLSASEPIYATKTVKVKKRKKSVQFDEKTGKYFIPAYEAKVGEYDAELDRIKKSYGSGAVISARRELEEMKLRDLGMTISTQTKALQYSLERIEELEERVAKLERER